MTKIELLRRKALWAESKAAEAADSNAPWAIRNLRLYQNMASRYWHQFYSAQSTTD